MTTAGRGKVRRRTPPPPAVRRSSAPYQDGGGSGGPATSGFTTGIRSPTISSPTRPHRQVCPVRGQRPRRAGHAAAAGPTMRRPPRRQAPSDLQGKFVSPRSALSHFCRRREDGNRTHVGKLFLCEPALQPPILRSAGLPQRQDGRGSAWPYRDDVPFGHRASPGLATSWTGLKLASLSSRQAHRASSRGAPTVHELTIPGVLAVRFLLHRRLYL